MKGMTERVRDLKKTDVKRMVEARINEFKKLGMADASEIFKELCFCILTANFRAERAMEIQRKIGNGFLTLSESQLAKKLRKLGHRYPNTRAKYVVEARKYRNSLKEMFKSFRDENEAREWLVKNVKGLGYKEASHFLRNVGFENVAIIDFHILDILEKQGVIKRPKSLNRTKYMEIENILRETAKKLGMSLAELDLYLWFTETGKILK